MTIHFLKLKKSEMEDLLKCNYEKITFPCYCHSTVLVQDLSAQKRIPHLQQVGDQYQLVVNGKPFLMLADELGNSTASTMESMDLVWPRLKKLNVNTVLTPVYWELL
jgi:hypothetical protein